MNVKENEIYQNALKKIENDKKCRPNFVVIESTGAIGPTGPTGPTGVVPEFSIGTVTTGAPGSNASVKISEI